MVEWHRIRTRRTHGTPPGNDGPTEPHRVQAEDLLRALGDESGQAIDAMRERYRRPCVMEGPACPAVLRSQTTGFGHDDSRRRIRARHPWRAVAIGAGIGTLLGDPAA